MIDSKYWTSLYLAACIVLLFAIICLCNCFWTRCLPKSCTNIGKKDKQVIRVSVMRINEDKEIEIVNPMFNQSEESKSESRVIIINRERSNSLTDDIDDPWVPESPCKPPGKLERSLSDKDLGRWV